MTRTTTTTLAVNADYADALLTARRARSWLFLLVLLVLLTQLALFFVVRFDVLKIRTSETPARGASARAAADSPALPPLLAAPAAEPGTTTPADGSTDDPAETPATTPPATDSPAPTAETRAPAEADLTAPTSTQPAGGLTVNLDTPGATPSRDRTNDVLRYVVNLTTYLGTALSIVLAVVVLLMVLVMLAGRLIGVAHVTSAFVWAVLLVVMLFPWQVFFFGRQAGHGHASMAATSMAAPAPAGSAATDGAADFGIPGVLYTWPELHHGARFGMDRGDPLPLTASILKWARFVGFPVLAILVLLAVQAKSGRGAKFALGEADVHVEVAQTDA